MGTGYTMTLADRETVGEWTRGLVDLLKVKPLATLMGVQPSTIYSWLQLQSTPRPETLQRLRLLHDCVEVILAGSEEHHAVIQWLYKPRTGSIGTPASELRRYYPSAYVDEDLLQSARGFVETLSTRSPDEHDRAAERFITLVASSVVAGVLGDRRGNRMLLRPAEAVEHARRVSEVRGEGPFEQTVNSIGRGLRRRGLATGSRGTSVGRRIDGALVRVWDMPVSAFEQVTSSAT